MDDTELKIKINPTFHEHVVSDIKWQKEDDETYQEYRRKWQDNPKNFIVERGPIHLDIETSSACNLRCPMCSCTVEQNKGINRAYNPGFMSMELFKKVLDDAAEVGVYSIKLNWRGEPLLNPNIVEMVQYAKKKGIIDIMINTNAVLLDEKIGRGLIEAGLDKIFFSVDSIDKEKYEKIRIGANFEKVIHNIKQFVALNNERGHSVQTRVQKVKLYETENEQREYEDFFCKIVDSIAYEDYIPYDAEHLGREVDCSKVVPFACCQLWQRLFVEYDGKYAMCCDTQRREYILGDANNEGIEEIWHGKKIELVRELHKKGRWNEFPACSKCYAPFM